MKRPTLARGTMATLCTTAILASVRPAAAGYWLKTSPAGAVFGGQIRVAASNPNTLYASGAMGSAIAVFKSTDAGANWTVALTSDAAGALAVDPTNPAIVFTGGLGGMSKTSDGGQTWNLANNGFTGSFIVVNSVAIDPANPSTVYAGVSSTTAAGLYKTTDGGAHWVTVAGGFPSFTPAYLAVAPSDPSTLYAGINGLGVYKSTNSGTSWVPITILSTGDFTPLALAIDPTTPTTVYAGRFVGDDTVLFKTTDGGGSWAPLNFDPHVGIFEVAISGSDPAILYLAASYNAGAYKSTNAGVDWVAENSGLASVDSAFPLPFVGVVSVAIDPVHPGAVYAGAYGFNGDGGAYVLLPLCNELPQAGCKLPTATKKATIQLTDKSSDKADLLSWTWTKGAATTKAEFGDPTTTTDYNVCVYDNRTGTPGIILGARVLSGRTCGTKPCWKATKTGFKYTDSKSTVDGVNGLVLTEGAAGKAKITLKAKGASVFMPTLPLTTAVTVQLVNSEGTCWEATYSANVTKNDAGQFKAKSD